jgi:hypothetical protein
MKHKKIFSNIIEECIAPFLVQIGYTRHKNYFYYKNDDMMYSYDCYLEKMSNKKFHFYIIASVDSTIFNKTINRTVEQLPSGYDNIYSKVIFESDNLKNESGQIQEKIISVLSKIENKLNTITNVENLVDVCIKENYLVHHEDLFKYLVITKDEKRLKHYLTFVRKRLNDIADRAYEAYFNKISTLKKELNKL